MLIEAAKTRLLVPTGYQTKGIMFHGTLVGFPCLLPYLAQVIVQLGTLFIHFFIQFNSIDPRF